MKGKCPSCGTGMFRILGQGLEFLETLIFKGRIKLPFFCLVLSCKFKGMFNKFFPVSFLLFSVGSLFAQFNPVFNNLVWADEFNGSGAIDDNKWFHQTLLPNGTSWWNGEQQQYTD